MIEEGNSPLQYSCLENPMDRGVWHRVARIRYDLVTKPTTTIMETVSKNDGYISKGYRSQPKETLTNQNWKNKTIKKNNKNKNTM